MELTLDEVESLLVSLRASVAVLTIYNEKTKGLESLAERLAVRKK